MTVQSKKFFSNTAYNVAGQACALIFGLATSAILARGLGVESRGLLAAVLLLPNSLVALIANGFNSTIVYSVASKKWTDEQVLPAVVGVSVYLLAVMTALGAAVLCFHETLFPGISLALLLGALAYLPLSLWIQSLANVFVGKQAFRQRMLNILITSPLNLLVFAFVLYFFPRQVEFGLLATVLGSLVTVAILYSGARAVCDQRQLFVAPILRLSELRGSLAYGSIAQLGGIARFFNYKADQFIVLWMIGAGPLGIYIIAVAVAEKLWVFVGNVSSVLFSLTAENKDDKQSSNIGSRVAALILWFNVALGLFLAAIAYPLVRFLYGAEFQAAGTVVLWLLPGIVLLGFAKVTANYLAGIGRPGINAVGSAAGLIINIVANIILIPRFGLIGAALATSISYSAIAVYSYFCFLIVTASAWHEPLIPRYRDLALISSYSRQLLPMLGRLQSKAAKQGAIE